MKLRKQIGRTESSAKATIERHNSEGDEAKRENCGSTRLSSSEKWTSGRHGTAQKRGKACRKKHKSPVQNRHPRKIIRSILESYILTPGKTLP